MIANMLSPCYTNNNNSIPEIKTKEIQMTAMIYHLDSLNRDNYWFSVSLSKNFLKNEFLLQ